MKFMRAAVEELVSVQPQLLVKIGRALFCQPDEARLALEEVLKFLTLAADNREGRLTPSRRVDLAWHEFLLFTRLYAMFCDQRFGKMIHHEPSSEHASNQRQYARTLQLYQQSFGEPDRNFWPQGEEHLASCGNCEAFP